LSHVKLALFCQPASVLTWRLMGRGRQTQPQIPASFIAECFTVGSNSGELLWRERPREHFGARPDDVTRFAAIRIGQPAGFKINGRHFVRVQFQGRTRRIAALRVAWCLSRNEWPSGQIKTRNNNDCDLRPENLQLIRRGHNPAAVGRSSLERRRAVDAKLIEALAVCSARDGPTTVAEIGRLAGLCESGASQRLSRLEMAGLAQGPHCVPGRSWMLTEEGRKHAEAGPRGPLDDVDQRVLQIIARSPLRQLELARRVSICSLTAKRRLGSLIAHGLAKADERRRYVVTDEGRWALGDAVPPRWVNLDRVRASTAPDVGERLRHPYADQTAAQRSAQASKAHAKALAYRTNKSVAYNAFPEWQRFG
jgi:Mn-dependent DtxR family transcriptional regulator